MALTDASSGRRTPAARRLPPPTQRRALELLASCPQEGCPEAVMPAHGFTIEQLVELVRAGLATATPQRVKAGNERMGGRHAADHRRGAPGATDAGRRALANDQIIETCQTPS
jgi:hypothetical protein